MPKFTFLRFERSGGFAGMTTVLDQESLSVEMAERIRDLMEETGLAALPSGMHAERRQPDEFTYTLIYLAGEVEQIKIFPESDMPDALRPLISFLSQTARHATRR